jgi:hypothetical protein
LIIREEEDNVWWGVRKTGTNRQYQDWQQQQKPSVHYFAIFSGHESKAPIVAAFERLRFIRSGIAAGGGIFAVYPFVRRSKLLPAGAGWCQWERAGANGSGLVPVGWRVRPGWECLGMRLIHEVVAERAYSIWLSW